MNPSRDVPWNCTSLHLVRCGYVRFVHESQFRNPSTNLHDEHAAWTVVPPYRAPSLHFQTPAGAELIGDHNAWDGHLTRVLFATQDLEPLDKGEVSCSFPLMLDLLL